MSKKHWTAEENDRIVAVYFTMLAKDLAGEPYSKAEYNRQLQEEINRSKGAIEFKNRNVSEVLRRLGETWISGYRPAANIQSDLISAVDRWLSQNQDCSRQAQNADPETETNAVGTLIVEPAPTLSNQPPPRDLEQLQRIARKFDFAGRDERNRALGRMGEKRVLAHERSVLRKHGRPDLAEGVKWISEEEGDGAGYDILSYDPDGQTRLIEVKTTRGWKWAPFYVSRNELRVSEKRRDEWRLMRLWDFAREPKAFELQPPLDAHVSLTATTYRASFT